MKTFLPFVILYCASSCASYYHQSFNPIKRLRTPTVTGRGEIYYPNYRLPQRPYIETGIFTMVSHRYSSNGMEKRLEEKLSEQGLDGAIVLAKSEIPHPESSASHELRYAGFVYLDHFDRLGIKDYLEIQYQSGDSLRDTSRVYFDWHGQIDSVKGSWSIFQKAAWAQPWYFIEQKSSDWLTAVRNAPFPGRQLKRPEGNVIYRFSPRDDQIRYKILDHALAEKRFAFFSDAGSQLQLMAIEEDDIHVEVNSVYVGNHLREQRWTSPDGKESFRLIYRYKSIEDIPSSWIVKPEDLVK